jgi:hypothetical protein
MAKVNSVCTSEKGWITVDHKGTSEYARAYDAHCPMRREGSNNAKTTEDKSTGRGTGEAASRSASFAQACEGMLAQRDLRAGEQALAIWR